MHDPGAAAACDDLQRHDLLTVDPVLWDVSVRADPRLGRLPLVVNWARRGWPVMVRRPFSDEHGVVPVAMPLPRPCVPHRIALALPPLAVRAREKPPRLAEIVPPARWKDAHEKLLAVGRAFAIEPRVFGSLMWEQVTGLSYLAPTSDIDLLWTVTEAAVAADLCRAIAAIETTTDVRIDGELIDTAGAAVQWREYAAGAPEVMVKTMRGVAVRRREHCFVAMAEALP